MKIWFVQTDAPDGLEHLAELGDGELALTERGRDRAELELVAGELDRVGEDLVVIEREA